MQVKILQDSSGVGISDEIFGFYLGSELGLPLGDLLYSDNWSPVGILLIVDIPPGSKVSYPELVGYSLSRHTFGASFSILSKVYTNSLWYVPYFYLANHA